MSSTVAVRRQRQPESFLPQVVPRGVRRIVHASIIPAPEYMTDTVPPEARKPDKRAQAYDADRPDPHNGGRHEDIEAKIDRLLTDNELWLSGQLATAGSGVIYSETA